MTSNPSRPSDVRPNVLRGEAAPNTLGGVGPRRPTPRHRAPSPPGRIPVAALAIVVAIVAAALILISGR